MKSKINDKSIILKLSPEIKELVYREVEFEYRTEDAKNHCEAALEDGTLKDVQFKQLTDSDYSSMAEDFLSEYDCNFAENDIWNNVIRNYAEVNL